MRHSILLCILCAAVWAQGPRPIDTLVSPEVHPDRKVTFRIRAPKAAEVALYGDWMPVGALSPMVRGSDGVWSITAGPVEATGHLYWFVVDGVTMADPVNPNIKLRQRTSASLLEVPADPPAPWDIRDVPHGTVVTEWHASKVLGRSERIFLYLPPGYQKSSLRFPVLYLVHGGGDVPDSWTNAGRANFILDNLIADRKAKPMIIVMPAGHAAPYGQTGAQERNSELFEKYLLSEVIPLVESRYRVAAGARNRAMAGLSMGAGLTIHTGFSHPELFSALGIFSPAMPRDFETRYQAALADPKATNARLTRIWIGCGDQDTTTRYDRVVEFDTLLEKRQIRRTMRTVKGGAHTWPVWRLCLSEFAPLLF